MNIHKAVEAAMIRDQAMRKHKAAEAAMIRGQAAQTDGEED